MLHRLLSCILICFGCFLLGAVALDRTVKTCWVGSTSLAVQIVVVDADSDKPIASARIEIHREGGSYESADAECGKLLLSFINAAFLASQVLA